MVKVRELFRDTEATEFVIVTIPTVMIFNFLFRNSSSSDECTWSLLLFHVLFNSILK